MKKSHSPPRAGAVLLLATAAAIGIAACSDLSSPARQTQSVGAPPNARHNAGTGDGVVRTFTVTANDTNGGGLYVVPDSMRYRHTLYAHVTASGTITRTPTYTWLESPGAQTSWGPEVASIDPGNGYSSQIIGSSGIDMVFLRGGPAGVGISGHDPGLYTMDNYHSPEHPFETCGIGQPVLCNHYSGTMTFTVTPYTADLTASADSSHYGLGSIASFTIGTSPSTILGHPTPLEIDSTWWMPDDPTDPHDPPVAGPSFSACADPAWCKRRVRGSGTFRIAAWVNGKWTQKSVRIEAPDLKLKAVRQSGPAGRIVTFSPAWTDGATVTVQQWSWAPDTAPANTAACPGTVGSCQTTVNQSGTMFVTATRGGVTRTARVHVVVIPCPTGDDILDDETTRQGLGFLFDANHSAAPQNRHEQAGWLFVDTLTGTYTFLPDLDPSHSTPCSLSTIRPAAPPNSALLALLHPHPLDPYTDSVPPHTRCNPSDKWLGSGRHSLSPRDLQTADSIQAPVFAIDRDSIYRGDGTNGPKRSWSRTSGCTIIPPMSMNRRPPRGYISPFAAATKRAGVHQ